MLPSHVGQQRLLWLWDKEQTVICKNYLALDFSEKLLKNTLVHSLRFCKVLRLKVMDQVNDFRYFWVLSGFSKKHVIKRRIAIFSKLI